MTFEVRCCIGFQLVQTTCENTLRTNRFTLRVALGHLADGNYTDVHGFSQTLPDIVYKGSQCRSTVHQPVLVPLSIFRILQKAAFGQPFPCEELKNPSRASAGRRHGTVLATTCDPDGPD